MAEYERLAGIAPVLAYRGEPLSYGYQERTFDVGRALGREELARRVETGAAVAEVRDAHPEFAGKTYSYSFHFGTDTIQTINSTRDYAAKLLGELGLSLPPAVQALEGDTGARISIERLGVLDADVLVMAFASDDLRASLEGNPLFRALPVVARGDYLAASLDTITALRSPSVLSIPYGLDQLVSGLAGALR